jgi:hypothetical protein
LGGPHLLELGTPNEALVARRCACQDEDDLRRLNQLVERHWLTVHLTDQAVRQPWIVHTDTAAERYQQLAERRADVAEPDDADIGVVQREAVAATGRAPPLGPCPERAIDQRHVARRADRHTQRHFGDGYGVDWADVQDPDAVLETVIIVDVR